jgi:hypothetical protein
MVLARNLDWMNINDQKAENVFCKMIVDKSDNKLEGYPIVGTHPCCISYPGKETP